MTKTIEGVVTKVGDKFNGSVQLDGKDWFNNKKGFANPSKEGDKVRLTLEQWEFKGKTGFNVAAVDHLATTPKTEAKTKDVTTAVGRDYDAENRGKVRHGLLVPLMPLIATDQLNVEAAKDIVTKLTEYVMKGE